MTCHPVPIVTTDSYGKSMSDNICKLCDLQADLPRDLTEYLKPFIEKIRVKDRASEDVRSDRLRVCLTCDRLSEATCLACGCYVELRAALKSGSCPQKKW